MVYNLYKAHTSFYSSAFDLYLPVDAEIKVFKESQKAIVSKTPKKVSKTINTTEEEWETNKGLATTIIQPNIIKKFLTYIGQFNDEEMSLEISIDHIDEKTGTIYINNPTNYQIEVWKYTQKSIYDKNKEQYSPHLGKRYKRLLQLKMGQKEWIVPDRWRRKSNRNHFKFALRVSANESGPLSKESICTTTEREYSAFGKKIYLIAQH